MQKGSGLPQRAVHLPHGCSPNVSPQAHPSSLGGLELQEMTSQVLRLLICLFIHSADTSPLPLSVLGTLLGPRETKEQERHDGYPVITHKHGIMTAGSLEPGSGPGSVSNLLCGLEQNPLNRFGPQFPRL